MNAATTMPTPTTIDGINIDDLITEDVRAELLGARLLGQPFAGAYWPQMWPPTD